ncbi:MAG: helix-turn-helix transcriptional regulator [Chloroflexi bacterium]|nr:MAG: helix-turn-helix transcriptional regulator [Chloroflexota bacterium]
MARSSVGCATPRVSRCRRLGATAIYLRNCASNERMTPMESTLTADLVRDRAATVARALSDAKRLCVVERLADGERSVSDLSRDVGCQVPNMSQHLAVLRAAGIVTSRREGSTVFYRLADPQVLEVYRILQQVAR